MYRGATLGIRKTNRANEVQAVIIPAFSSEAEVAVTSSGLHGSEEFSNNLLKMRHLRSGEPTPDPLQRRAFDCDDAKSISRHAFWPHPDLSGTAPPSSLYSQGNLPAERRPDARVARRI
jgi:hypothetical protein